MTELTHLKTGLDYSVIIRLELDDNMNWLRKQYLLPEVNTHTHTHSRRKPDHATLGLKCFMQLPYLNFTIYTADKKN
jgi:hypothetical protein